jgi:hypothetical protein
VKLKGILSSHARYAEHLARLERDAPKPLQPQQSEPSPHAPQVQSDGTIRCCGTLYARHAHAAHLRGDTIGESCSGVRVVAEDRAEMYAEWERARQQPAPLQPGQRPEDNAEWRAEMVRRYYENEKRGRRSFVADGVEPSIYGW